MQQGYAAVLCECSLGVGGRGWVTSGVTPGGVPGVGRLMPLAFGCPGVLAVLGLEAAAPGECELTRLLQDKLQYEMRLQYMVTPRLEGGREGDVWHCRAQVCSRGTCRLYSERVLGGGWVVLSTGRGNLCPTVSRAASAGASSGLDHVKGLFCRFPSVTPWLAGVSLSPCCQPLRSSLPFQKHYFPINYTVQVQYEEVLRPSNITRLVR